MTDFKIGDEVRVKTKGLMNVPRAAGRLCKIVNVDDGLYRVDFDTPVTSNDGVSSSVWTARPVELELMKTARTADVGSVTSKAIDVQEGGSHYKDMAIQPITYIMANNIPFAEGNVIKYTTRWRKKGGIVDLRKARHMLDVLIEEEEKKLHAAQ